MWVEGLSGCSVQESAPRVSAVREAVGYGYGRGAEVDQRREPLQAVMARLMEEVTEANHAGGFACKIHSQPRSTATEKAGHRVQFTAAVLQIGVSHREIGGAGRRHRGEKKAIPFIPELVPAGGLWQGLWSGCNCRWRKLTGLGIQHGPGLLSQGRRAEHGRKQQYLDGLLEHWVKPVCRHDFSGGSLSARGTSTTGFPGS